jgi:hypothetical protein
MSLPSSGTISWSNLVLETGILPADVGIGQFSIGTSPFLPINVNSANDGKYPIVNSPFTLSPTNFYGYNASASITADGTNGLLFITSDSAFICYPRAMLVYDMGTTDKAFTISYNYTNIVDYGREQTIIFYYGSPIGDNEIIYQAGAPTNTQYTGSNSFTYNYVYQSRFGQYVYAVVVGVCP